jgi:hypothetical protein
VEQKREEENEKNSTKKEDDDDRGVEEIYSILFHHYSHKRGLMAKVRKTTLFGHETLLPVLDVVLKAPLFFRFERIHSIVW